MYRRYRPLAIPQTQPTPRPFPAGCYARMNPLLRWFGLHVLAASLPEPLRASLIHAWMHPGRFDGNQAIPSRERQRYAEETLPFLPPSLLGTATHVELEVGRRIVESPRAELPGAELSAALARGVSGAGVRGAGDAARRGWRASRV